MSIMLSEIYEQPMAVQKAVDSGRETVLALVKELKRRNIRHVVIAARGTSDNAAVYAKYLIEIVCGKSVALAAPSVTTLYDAVVDMSDCLVLGISQSGQATDVVQTLAAARASGALTAGITNVVDSPLTGVSDFVLLCQAGEERAVAATKTYTTSLALVALLAGLWAENEEILEGLQSLPQKMMSALQLDKSIVNTVERYRYMQECTVLARGLNQATALESALKMTETSYLVCKPYSGADFLHGPVAMVNEGFPCILYAPDGKAYPFMVELAEKLRDRGAELIIFARDSSILTLATRPLMIGPEVSELLSPILYILPGQLWACHLAQTRGQNPDQPRGLSKVTLTR